MKGIKGLMWILVLILVVVGVNAQPPFEEQTQYLDGVLKVETLEITKHEVNTPFYLHSHIYSTSTGLIKDTLVDNVSCDYHLYSENINWEHLDVGVLITYGAGMFTNINESNFNETGAYTILLWCEADESGSRVGGYTRFSFEVVEDVKEEELSFNNIFYPGLIIVLAFLISGFIFKQPIIGIIGGLSLVVLSLTMLTSYFMGFGVIAGLVLSLVYLFMDM